MSFALEKNLCGHKSSILEISARWSVLLEMVTYIGNETFEVVFQTPVSVPHDQLVISLNCYATFINTL